MENEDSKGLLNVHRAHISECYIASKVRKEGYVVRKLAKQGKKLSEGFFKPQFVYLNDKGIEDVFKQYTGDKELLLNLLKDNLVGLPDFICLKDNKISFIEVKTERASLSEEQGKVFHVLKNNGFEVTIRRVRVNLEVEELNLEEKY